MSIVLVHRHLLLKGVANNIPKWDETKYTFYSELENYLSSWLRQLVEKIGMNVFISPKSRYCVTPGNEGITGIVCLETSHASIHFWEKDNSFKFDLYSCQDFLTEKVIEHLETFGLISYEYIVVDRENFGILDSGKRIPRG